MISLASRLSLIPSWRHGTAALKIFFLFLLLALISVSAIGCTNKRKSDPREVETTPAAPKGEVAVEPTDPTKPVINVRDGIVYIAPGSQIVPEKTTQGDVESILGMPDRSDTSASPLYNIFCYDKLGIRYATYRRTGIVIYFDLYLADPDEYGPKAPFPGTLTFSGHRVTAQTTKMDFERFGTEVSSGLFGYSVRFRNNKTVRVDLVKGTATIHYIRFMD